MKNRSLVITLCLAGFAAGLVPAQAPPPPPPGPRAFGPGRGFGGPLSERRLAAQLNLTAEQQNKIHTALQEAQVLQQGMGQRERGLRTQLAAAVRAGNEAQIDSITQEMSQLNQQRSAIRAKSLAKVYGALTADQKTRIDRQLDGSLGVAQPRGPRRGGRGGPPAPPAPQQQ